MDRLDPNKYVSGRLFREDCTDRYDGMAKDLKRLGRKAKDCIILASSPYSYVMNPSQGIPIPAWNNNAKDRHLLDVIPTLIQLSKIEDCRSAITQFVKKDKVDYDHSWNACFHIIQNQKRLKQLQIFKL